MAEPKYTTNTLRRYIESKVFRPIHPLRIFNAGELPAGIILTATGRLGSNTREVKKGKRHPVDLYAEVLKRRPCKQPIFDRYWVLCIELTDPFRAERLGRVDSKKMRKQRISKKLLEIELNRPKGQSSR